MQKKKIAEMFDDISLNYDFLNHFFSLGIDIYWRKKAANILEKYSPQKILDAATGTGDLAIELVNIHPEKIVGIDISQKMLNIAREKVEKLGLEKRIELIYADVAKIPFENGFFDAVTVGFGVRNFENLNLGLQEMYRVMRKNGVIVILEFSKPKVFPIKNIFNIYFKYIVPFVGRFVSKNKFAYSYLPHSVETFSEGNDFLEILKKAGFSKTEQIKLTFGIASIYTGIKNTT